MISVSEATQKTLANTQVLRIISRPVDADLVGYVLAENVAAPESVPAFRASIVDGYAVIGRPPSFPVNISIRWQGDISSSSSFTCFSFLTKTPRKGTNCKNNHRSPPSA
jgi:hypothetical protein